MGKKGPLWWRESDWLLRGSSAANQILLRHSGPILSVKHQLMLWGVTSKCPQSLPNAGPSKRLNTHPKSQSCV